MTTKTIGATALLAAVLLLPNSGCVSKQVHCKFVNDVGAAAADYKACATKANMHGWQAEALELEKIVDSEKQNYCK
jgi:hypothetical protein